MGCGASSGGNLQQEDDGAEASVGECVDDDVMVKMNTACGVINLILRSDAAPITCDYIVKAVKLGLYNGKTFYRSDFVIQCGLHGSGVEPPGNLPKNETHLGRVISNTRGTCAIAHWDVPDNGNTEFFINLKTNSHLDDTYGGYCVFAEVADSASLGVVDKIAASVEQHGKVGIYDVSCREQRARIAQALPNRAAGPAAGYVRVVVDQIGTIPIMLNFENAPSTCAALRKLAAAGIEGQFHRAEPIPLKGSGGPPYALVQASVQDDAGALHLAHEGNARIRRGMACLIGGTSDIFISLAAHGEHDGWEGSMTVFGHVDDKVMAETVERFLCLPIHSFTHPNHGTVMRMLNAPLKLKLTL